MTLNRLPARAGVVRVLSDYFRMVIKVWATSWQESPGFIPGASSIGGVMEMGYVIAIIAVITINVGVWLCIWALRKR